MSDQLLYQIALTQVPQVGAVTARNLVSYCGDAAAIFRATRKELLKIPGIGASTADCIRSAQPLLLAERELAFIETHDITPLFYTHKRYPARLRQCADAPAMLYFKGADAQVLEARRVVSVVGTRQPTEYGKAICEELIEGLRAYDVLIVSGLAYGIDVTAHRKASAVSIPNIGVLGHGLASIYPSTHRSVAMRMIEHGGLLTEYTHDTKPDKEHFPMRNRIIAGMCDALIVVETAATGGSMISAELAGQYEREVFAVPGRIQDPKSIGCNLLLKSNRARLIESAEDLAAALQWAETGKTTAIQPQLFPELSEAELKILHIIRQYPEIPIDQLTQQSGLSPGVLSSLLLGLELQGIIRTLPGKRYLVLA